MGIGGPVTQPARANRASSRIVFTAPSSRVGGAPPASVFGEHALDQGVSLIVGQAALVNETRLRHLWQV
jgi:hypothetical protein